MRNRSMQYCTSTASAVFSSCAFSRSCASNRPDNDLVDTAMAVSIFVFLSLRLRVIIDLVIGLIMNLRICAMHTYYPGNLKIPA